VNAKTKPRAKLSTTVAPETYKFLEQKVRSGKAATLAEALDAAVARLRRLENRARLAQATAAYFADLDSQTLAEDNALAGDMAAAARGMDFDREI
jgi:hypothetical protein